MDGIGSNAGNSRTAIDMPLGAPAGFDCCATTRCNQDHLKTCEIQVSPGSFEGTSGTTYLPPNGSNNNEGTLAMKTVILKSSMCILRYHYNN